MTGAQCHDWQQGRRLRLRAATRASAAPSGALLAALRRLDGVTGCVVEDGALYISYDLRRLTFAEIRAAATASGGAADDSPLNRLRYALIDHREEIQREDIDGVAGWDDYVRRIYVNRYRHRRADLQHRGREFAGLRRHGH